MSEQPFASYPEGRRIESRFPAGVLGYWDDWRRRRRTASRTQSGTSCGQTSTTSKSSASVSCATARPGRSTGSTHRTCWRYPIRGSPGSRSSSSMTSGPSSSYVHAASTTARTCTSAMFRSAGAPGGEGMNNPNIVSVGDDWRSWPRETWGTRDRVHAARRERVRAQLKGFPSSWEAFDPGARDMPGFRHLNPPRSRATDARGRQIDAILDHLGIEQGRKRPPRPVERHAAAPVMGGGRSHDHPRDRLRAAGAMNRGAGARRMRWLVHLVARSSAESYVRIEACCGGRGEADPRIFLTNTRSVGNRRHEIIGSPSASTTSTPQTPMPVPASFSVKCASFRACPGRDARRGIEEQQNSRRDYPVLPVAGDR